MSDSLFDRIITPASVARAYVTAYCDKDFTALRLLLHPEKFQFSHQSRGVSAASADEFMALLEDMARDIFPDRRFTQIHGLHVVDDVVLIDASWKGTPIVTIADRFQAGVERTMQLKSMIVVEDGLITQIRDHNS